MDPNTNQLLRDILEKTEENNKLLKKIHRANMWGRAFRIFYWLIIIGVTLGAYYFIQPYIESLLGAYQSLISGVETIQGSAESLQNVGSQIPDFGALLKGFGQ